MKAPRRPARKSAPRGSHARMVPHRRRTAGEGAVELRLPAAQKERIPRGGSVALVDLRGDRLELRFLREAGPGADDGELTAPEAAALARGGGGPPSDEGGRRAPAPAAAAPPRRCRAQAPGPAAPGGPGRAPAGGGKGPPARPRALGDLPPRGPPPRRLEPVPPLRADPDHAFRPPRAPAADPGPRNPLRRH